MRKVICECIKIIAPIVILMVIFCEFFIAIKCMILGDAYAMYGFFENAPAMLLNNFFYAIIFLIAALANQFACKMENRTVFLYFAYSVLMLFLDKIPSNVYLNNSPVPIALRLCVLCFATLPVLSVMCRALRPETVEDRKDV